MSRNFPFDTQRQAALAARYKTESEAQLRWYVKCKNAGKDPSAVESNQMDVYKRRLGAPEINDRMKELAEKGKTKDYRRTVRNFDDEILSKLNLSDIKDFKEMRPASPSTKALLYDGFSHEGKGRSLYLRTRYKKNPDNKFEFPILSSLDYGWRLDDIIKVEDIKKPPHGRTQLIENTFYKRNGIPMKHNEGTLQRNNTIF